ncbi:hypothetical protein [uncultured Williamsia sp.]|uniref:hypothetical protein n=1 Tax=uncultured Williamsia sp. TaxID=259311 RepID=UPI002625CBC3|nr:hypothetical protein [uncultured Williamsia sp.]
MTGSPVVWFVAATGTPNSVNPTAAIADTGATTACFCCVAAARSTAGAEVVDVDAAAVGVLAVTMLGELATEPAGAVGAGEVVDPAVEVATPPDVVPVPALAAVDEEGVVDVEVLAGVDGELAPGVAPDPAVVTAPPDADDAPPVAAPDCCAAGGGGAVVPAVPDGAVDPGVDDAVSDAPATGDPVGGSVPVDDVEGTSLAVDVGDGTSVAVRVVAALDEVDESVAATPPLEAPVAVSAPAIAPLPANTAAPIPIATAPVFIHSGTSCCADARCRPCARFATRAARALAFARFFTR